MAVFNLTTLTNSPDSAQYETWLLGVSTSTKLTDNDIGKALKGATSDNMVLCATTNEIEGLLVAVEAETYNDGFAYGTVQRRGRAYANVGANVATVVAPGDLVVADTQAAIDTAGGLQVIVGTPSEHLWRCIRIVSGTGVADDTVLIERV